MSNAPITRVYEPNPALRTLYRWFFDNIEVEEGWIREVRRLSAEGTVVYVLRSLNLVDFLALDHLTKRYDLPLIRYANDLRLGPLNPMSKGVLASLVGSSKRQIANELTTAVSNGGSAALFLKRPPSVIDVAAGAARRRGLREGDHHVRTLIELQRTRPRPILLVPQVFVWTNRPDTQGSQLLDPFFGPREWPSSLRTVGQFLYNYKHVQLKAGEPFDLEAYLANSEPVSDDVHVRRVVYAMLRRLERERRVVTGPAQKPPDRQRHQILRSPKLQKTIARMGGEREEDRLALIRRSLKMLRQIQATPDTPTIKALEVLLDRVFHRIYAGIDIDEKGVERLKELARDGSLVLLPSHKSHVDYLVLSFIFNEMHLQLPMIAAGDNLSFFPLGPILRRAGGFFIRRSFRGDKLYSATVEAYVRRLLLDGYALELFVEGGRSRTGKLLTPKFGLLAMIVDAALGVHHRDVHFVPISIGYERIVETGAYEHELTGGEKQKEDAGGLLKSTEVLRHRYGRINVQFGQPLTLPQMHQELGLPTDGELTPAKRRAIVTRLANRAMDEINRVTAVTPGALTALALLSDRRRSVAHEELLERCDKLLGVLRQMGARITPRTGNAQGVRPNAIREVVQMFADAELLEAHSAGDSVPPVERRGGRAGSGMIYRVPERRRLELDTSKNHIVHFFVERALVATAMLNQPGPPVALELVHERVQTLSRLFKHEFRFRADAGFDEIFEDVLRSMEEDGELVRDGTQLGLGEGHSGWPARIWLRTYASILRNFVEGYKVAARGLQTLLKGPLPEKDLLKKSLAVGNRMFLTGDIELPEAVSKPLIANAILSFRDEGYLQLDDGKYGLTESFRNAETLAAVEGRINTHLDLQERDDPSPQADSDAR